MRCQPQHRTIELFPKKEILNSGTFTLKSKYNDKCQLYLRLLDSVNDEKLLIFIFHRIFCNANLILILVHCIVLMKSFIPTREFVLPINQKT